MNKTASFPMALAALAFGADHETAKAASVDGIYAWARLSAMCADLQGVWYAGGKTADLTEAQSPTTTPTP